MPVFTHHYRSQYINLVGSIGICNKKGPNTMCLTRKNKTLHIYILSINRNAILSAQRRHRIETLHLMILAFSSRCHNNGNEDGIVDRNTPYIDFVLFYVLLTFDDSSPVNEELKASRKRECKYIFSFTTFPFIYTLSKHC